MIKDFENIINSEHVVSMAEDTKKQEHENQLMLLHNNVIPIKTDNWDGDDILLHMGFELLEPVDDLFRICTYPKGWTRAESTQRFLIDIFDEHGRNRASIFFCEFLEERESILFFNTRFSIQYRIHEIDNTFCYYSVYDEEEKKDVFSTKYRKIGCSYDKMNYNIQEAEDWLENNYRYWEDPLEYCSNMT